MRQLERLNLRATARVALALCVRYGVDLPSVEPEHKLIRRIVRPGHVAFDVGANVGQYTFQLSRLVGNSGRVFSYEPLPSSAHVMETVSRLLHLSNVSVIETALSNSIGMGYLSTPEDAFGGRLDGFAHLQIGNHRSAIQVRVTTIDNEVKRQEVQSIDFVKCDAEGAEYSVFEGGRDSISRFRPAILCEIEDRWSKRYGHERREVMRFIEKLGDYSSYVFEDDALIPLAKAKCYHNNVVFLTSSRARGICP